MFVLSVLGAIFLFLIAKFFWDEHIKPAGAAIPDHRITPAAKKASTASASFAPDMEKEKAMQAMLFRDISIDLLANRLECPLEDVELIYKQMVAHDLSSRSGLESKEHLKELVYATNTNKYKEAKEVQNSLGISVSPEDTCSGIMGKWINEVAVELEEERNAIQRKQITNESRGPVTINDIQKYNDCYKITFQQSHNGTIRRASELISEEIALRGNNGNPFYVGQVITGFSVNMITSNQPFFDGQKLDSVTGLYRKILMEPAQPGKSHGDRNVSNIDPY